MVSTFPIKSFRPFYYCTSINNMVNIESMCSNIKEFNLWDNCISIKLYFKTIKLSQLNEFFFKIDINFEEKIFFFSNQNIYFTVCEKVDKIEVVENIENCFRETQVKFELEDQIKTGFLNKEGIISDVSVKKACSNEKEVISISNIKSSLAKFQNQVKEFKTKVETSDVKTFDDNIYNSILSLNPNQTHFFRFPCILNL